MNTYHRDALQLICISICRYEAVIFILLYLVYIIIMFYNAGLEEWFTTRFTCCYQGDRLPHQIQIPMTDTVHRNGKDKHGSNNNNGYAEVSFNTVGKIKQVNVSLSPKL